MKLRKRLAVLAGDEEDTRDIPTAAEPGVDGVPLENDYNYLRGSRDVVISGPLVPATGPGRSFNTKEEAHHWAMDYYGERGLGVCLLDYEGATRWAVLVKNLKS